VITVSGKFQGAVQIAAGVFMIIMGLNMLGIFPALRRFNIRMPRVFAKKIDEQKSLNKNPLIVGLLNGLMPCGPLQAMQLYALSTGSPVAGGVSMFLFSMGTVPLMFGIGALSSLLSGAKGKSFSAAVMKVGAVLVAVLGLTMFSNGWSLSGLSNPLLAVFNPFGSSVVETAAGSAGIVIEDGVQIINSSLSPGRYPAIVVQAGLPVKWTINAPQGSINGCNNRMIIREYGIEHRFVPGENVVAFTPEKTGKFGYSCWMGMIRSFITVVAEGEAVPGETDLGPVPAGVSIPTGEFIAAAPDAASGIHQVAISLRDDGIVPAIIVMERNAKTVWTVNNDSLDPGNSSLNFPVYGVQVPMGQGENYIQIIPTEDFAFSTADNVFFAYVKVVDDISNFNIEAIKGEVSQYETQIYPDEYFASGGGMSCCR
jgi:plastocyanin domain-containing protein